MQQKISGTDYILPLASAKAAVEIVGGKGANLARLRQAGLPVPDGFYLSTAAYRQFVAENQLQPQIAYFLSHPAETAGLAGMAEKIEALFAAGEMPEAVSKALMTGYAELGEGRTAVAVRSSATTEDLPEMSFAGQQSTFLNVQGVEAVITAVKGCWASLWSAPAISYRQRLGIEHEAVAMGVVIQKLVPAEVSGILFTANPTSGERGEMVINAGYGLGEAIVSGQVTPDTLVLEHASGEVKSRQIGDKSLRLIAARGQGLVESEVSQEEQAVAVLSDAEISSLHAHSLEIEALFDQPQDIEWAIAEGKCWILQSRPITNLPPPPLRDVAWEAPDEGGKLIRRQVVEHMPGPLSPLFDDLYLSLGLDESMAGFIKGFGIDFEIERLVKRPFFLTVNGFAYSRADYNFSWGLVAQIFPIYFKMLPKLFRHVITRWRDDKLPAYRALIAEWRGLEVADAPELELWRGMRTLSIADAYYWFEVSIVLGIAKVSDNLLRRFLVRLGEKRGLTSGRFLRGFDSKTLEAQIDLEALAERIRQSARLRSLVEHTPPAGLWSVLRLETEAAEIVEGLEDYIEAYGHQIYTLDFAEPTLGEEGIPIWMSLKDLIERPTDAAARQAILAQEREQLAEETARSLWPIRRWIFRKLLGWAQKYAPYREDALFYIGAAWPVLRQLALELGDRLARRQVLANPADIFYLKQNEIEGLLKTGLDSDNLADYREMARQRRELRQARQRLHPPGKIPDVPYKIGPIDMSIFETQKVNESTEGVMTGFAVSPGKVVAPASVILSPADFEKMRSGTILVCPTTTPAWTPLFTQAAGLVTDIGGILAHGSIVAREYGIPAVMGLGNATLRITDGQIIALDGDRGVVEIEES